MNWRTTVFFAIEMHFVTGAWVEFVATPGLPHFQRYSNYYYSNSSRERRLETYTAAALLFRCGDPTEKETLCCAPAIQSMRRFISHGT